MKRIMKGARRPVDGPRRDPDGRNWTLKEKLLLGLTPREYASQAVRNPFNWVIWSVLAVGLPVTVVRFVGGLGAVTHGSNDYPWGLFLGFGLFCMVPLSASGFMLGTTVEVFGRHDFEPIERLALLNGLLGYLFAVIYLLYDLGQPWRLYYPMAYSWGPAAVLFLVGWHVATYLSVQVAEVSASFFDWAGWRPAKRFIRRIALGLTIAGIILSTLHQGALGALFTYAPGKVHPLWYSASFQWIFFFCSSIPAGLCMVILVSTVVKRTMAWRCDPRFLDNLDRITLGLAKGASLALVTYLTIKLIGLAHDNEWAYLATGWGAWYGVEMIAFVIAPIAMFAYAVHHERVGLARFAALVTVLGVVLNRLNTSMVAMNWNLYNELPALGELVIVVMVFTVYLTVYRFLLYRLPILYAWKAQEQEEAQTATVCEAGEGLEPIPQMAKSTS